MIITRALLLLLICANSFADQKLIYSGLETTVQVDTRPSELLITFSARRDSGPVTRMDASGLIVEIDFYTKNREKLTEVPIIEHAKVNFHKQIWDMLAVDEKNVSKYFDGTGYTYTFRQGPSWPINSEVSVNLNFSIHSEPYVINSVKIKILKSS